MSRTNPFQSFSEVSSRQWKQRIQADLKGADYNESLVWESPEGISVKPFYHAEDLEEDTLFRPLPSRKWKIGQQIFAGVPESANARALEVLKRGVESLFFTIPSGDINLKGLLNGIDLKTTSIHFRFQFLSARYLRTAADMLHAKSTAIHLNVDPVGYLARTGNWFGNRDNDLELLGEVLDYFSDREQCRVLGVDMSLYQNAGANTVQQLAYGMAHANEYLNKYYRDGANRRSWSGITFQVSTGSNYFFEIAKLRALRILWERLADAYGLPGDCHIMAWPTRRNKTLYEYNTNMLRTTMECMSAILGGADTVCTLPYDTFYHKDNEFGERIARNQLLILKYESHLDKVCNAADGAYYIEKLTKQLAEKSLSLFKNIETGGGFLSQLKNHTLQKKIRESAQKEQHLFNDGKEVLVGANAYQNLNDRMKETLELYPFLKANPGKTLIAPIFEKRLSEDWEQERLRYE